VRAALIVNPTKVTDRQRALIDAALGAAGLTDPLWRETSREDPGRGQTRQALAAGVEVVLAAGGDGTVRACADGLAGSPVPLAVLPVGTGNRLAANLGLPTDVDAVLAAVVTGRRRKLDLGRVDLGRLDRQHFAVMAGIGFDAAMMEATPESWKRWLGWPAYLFGGVRRLSDRPMRVQLRLDDGPVIERHARTVLVANVGRLQGGVDLFGDARPDDGLLDVAVIKPRGPADWAVLGLHVMLRRRPRRHHVETFRASTVDVRTRTVQPRQLDGDPIAPGDRLCVSICPDALWVCVP
jgi:diacylglycerol kinase family enzyme